MASPEPANHPPGSLHIVVVYSPSPREVCEWCVTLAPGSTVKVAILASGVFVRFPELAAQMPEVGIWGRKVGPDAQVKDGDRIELYRNLRVDPKVARRERFNSQGARSAGLFAKRREGGKAGY